MSSTHEPETEKPVTRQSGEAALGESGEKCRTILESASEAIVIGEATGRIVFFNRKAEEIFGYKREEIFGKTIEVLIPGRMQQSKFSSKSLDLTRTGLQFKGFRGDWVR